MDISKQALRTFQLINIQTTNSVSLSIKSTPKIINCRPLIQPNIDILCKYDGFLV